MRMEAAHDVPHLDPCLLQKNGSVVSAATLFVPVKDSEEGTSKYKPVELLGEDSSKESKPSHRLGRYSQFRLHTCTTITRVRAD
jgi:hypothetical protein